MAKDSCLVSPYWRHKVQKRKFAINKFGEELLARAGQDMDNGMRVDFFILGRNHRSIKNCIQI